MYTNDYGLSPRNASDAEEDRDEIADESSEEGLRHEAGVNADGEDVERQGDDVLGRVGKLVAVDRVLDSAPDVMCSVHFEIWLK
jgi:hypothetical protein